MPTRVCRPRMKAATARGRTWGPAPLRDDRCSCFPRLRPFHSAYPSERLGRAVAARNSQRCRATARWLGDGGPQTGLSGPIGDFVCALDAVRQGIATGALPRFPMIHGNAPTTSRRRYFTRQRARRRVPPHPEHLLPAVSSTRVYERRPSPNRRRSCGCAQSEYRHPPDASARWL